jgi:hypothetical protein
MGIEYKCYVEEILHRSNSITRKDGRLNKQELTTNIGDRKLREIVIFGNNPLYDKYHFISSYIISLETSEDFVITSGLGLSSRKKLKNINKWQRVKAQEQKKQDNERLFYKEVLNETRLGNKQLREVEIINQQLKEDSDFSLTQEEKNLMERAEKHEKYKNGFYKDNSDNARDEL